jgi:hypothetical protein
MPVFGNSFPFPFHDVPMDGEGRPGLTPCGWIWISSNAGATTVVVPQYCVFCDETVPENDQPFAVGCVNEKRSCVKVSASTAPRAKNAPTLRSAPTPKISEGAHRVCVNDPAPPTVGPR